MCYKLRCAFLHSGNSDIEDFGKKEDHKINVLDIKYGLDKLRVR